MISADHTIRQLMFALFLAMSAACVPGAHQARADAPYPARPVRIILPNGVGGVADTTVRVVAEKLSDKLGQPSISRTSPAPAVSPRRAR